MVAYGGIMKNNFKIISLVLLLYFICMSYFLYAADDEKKDKTPQECEDTLFLADYFLNNNVKFSALVTLGENMPYSNSFEEVIYDGYNGKFVLFEQMIYLCAQNAIYSNNIKFIANTKDDVLKLADASKHNYSFERLARLYTSLASTTVVSEKEKHRYLEDAQTLCPESYNIKRTVTALSIFDYIMAGRTNEAFNLLDSYVKGNGFASSFMYILYTGFDSILQDEEIMRVLLKGIQKCGPNSDELIDSFEKYIIYADEDDLYRYMELIERLPAQCIALPENMKKIGEARKRVKKSHVYDEIAIREAKEKRYNHALKELEKIQEKARDKNRVKYEIGAVHWDNGKKKKAIEAWYSLLDKNYAPNPKPIIYESIRRITENVDLLSPDQKNVLLQKLPNFEIIWEDQTMELVTLSENLRKKLQEK